jgi:hypothetical protein
MYIRNVKFEERRASCASEKSFKTLKASITLKQVCQSAKEFTQSFVAHTIDTRGVCRKFLRRIYP